MTSSTWPVDGILKGTTNPGQIGPESNGNDRVLHIPETLGLKPYLQMQFSVFKCCYVTLNSI